MILTDDFFSIPIVGDGKYDSRLTFIGLCGAATDDVDGSFRMFPPLVFFFRIGIV